MALGFRRTQVRRAGAFARRGLALAAFAAGARAQQPAVQASSPTTLVHGMTVSCQTSGREWASDAFGPELERLESLGVNWVSIHPYARIAADGTVSWREFDPASGPAHVVRLIREAHARGLAIFVTPHLAYWGSPFRSRGEIDFAEPAARERFFATYRRWIAALAAAAREADAFAVGNELDRLVAHEAEWRRVVGEVRGLTSARLTYAANWTDFERVPFWDALDAVGVQGYFPLSESADPSREELERGWDGVLVRLRAIHERTGKPVVLTELGYNCSLDAARTPWSDRDASGAERERAQALQRRCLEVGLSVLERERAWLRGAFLWKWFVGPAPGENFVLDTPALREAIARAWAPASAR